MFPLEGSASYGPWWKYSLRTYFYLWVTLLFSGEAVRSEERSGRLDTNQGRAEVRTGRLNTNQGYHLQTNNRKFSVKRYQKI